MILLILLQVETGLERLDAKLLEGKRVGLVTNHTGIDRSKKSTIDLLVAKAKVTTLFSPEHGIRGTEDVHVASGKDEKTGLPIHSLYGKTKKPTKEMLENVDVLVFDIQDIGSRFYTYITTMALVMQAAAEHDKLVVVLDRPNPIGGEIVEGPILEESLRGGFASYYPIPTRHGMTVGELALLFNAEFKIGCRLEVVKLSGWKRSMFFDETKLPWVNPSPNMRSLDAAISYPGLGALEATNLSVGRGTDRPFHFYGAPWIDETKLCDDLNARGLRGVRFKPTKFTPAKQPGMPTYPHTDKECHGFEVEIADRRAYRPLTAVLHVLDALHRHHPKEFSFGNAPGMIGLKSIDDDIKAGKKIDEIEKSWKVEEFRELRKKYLLYR